MKRVITFLCLFTLTLCLFLPTSVLAAGAGEFDLAYQSDAGTFTVSGEASPYARISLLVEALGGDLNSIVYMDAKTLGNENSYSFTVTPAEAFADGAYRFTVATVDNRGTAAQVSKTYVTGSNLYFGSREIAANQTLSVSAVIANDTQDTIVLPGMEAFIAVYDGNGTLVSVVRAEVAETNVTPGGAELENIVSYTVPSETTGTENWYARAFLWKNGTVQPVLQAADTRN